MCTYLLIYSFVNNVNLTNIATASRIITGSFQNICYIEVDKKLNKNSCHLEK